MKKPFFLLCGLFFLPLISFGYTLKTDYTVTYSSTGNFGAGHYLSCSSELGDGIRYIKTGINNYPFTATSTYSVFNGGSSYCSPSLWGAQGITMEAINWTCSGASSTMVFLNEGSGEYAMVECNMGVYEKISTSTTETWQPPAENEVIITSPIAGEVTASSTVDIDFNYYVSLPGTFILNLETYESCLGTPETYRFTLDTDTLGVSSDSFQDIQLQENKTYWATVRYINIFQDEGDPTEGISSATILFHVVATSTEYMTETSAFQCSLGRMENRLKYKLPWGYYFLFQEKIEEMNDATSTEIILPLATLNSDTFGNINLPDVTILNTAWFQQDSDFFGPIWDEWIMINNILVWVMWGLFGWWIYRLAEKEKSDLQ